MSPLEHSNNLAARMGRWSASHWKTAVFGWLVFVVAALVIGQAIGTKRVGQDDGNVGEARRADHILKDAGFQPHPQQEIVLVQSTSLGIDDPAFRAALEDVVRTVDFLPHDHEPALALDGRPRGPRLPRRTDGARRVGDEGRREDREDEHRRGDGCDRCRGGAAPFPLHRPGRLGQLQQGAQRGVFEAAEAGRHALGPADAAHPRARLRGDRRRRHSASARAVGRRGDDRSARPAEPLDPLDSNVDAVVLLVGLAVGVDYTLFYLKREREERAAGRDERAALEAAAATSGRAVLVSGLTVMVAMAGMLLTGDPTFMGFGLATMAVVAVAMLGSLTVLPALLSKLGDRVENGRIPFLRRIRRESGENRFWNAILTPALRRPALALAASTAVLLALATPVLHLHTAETGLNSMAKSLPTVDTLQRIEASFPETLAGDRRRQSRRQLAAVRDAIEPAALAGARERAHAWADRGGRKLGRQRHARPDPVQRQDHRRDREPALETLRSQLLPDTVGRVEGATYAVTGGTASSHDHNATLKQAAPIVFGFVLTFAFLLLLVTFRSLVVAAKAIVLNLLSVAAAYGLMILVFQRAGARASSTSSRTAPSPGGCRCSCS